MAQTVHHLFPVPDPATVFKPRLDITALAEDVDAKTPKITYGSGAAPIVGVRAGDIHLQYVLPAAGVEQNVPLPEDIIPPIEE